MCADVMICRTLASVGLLCFGLALGGCAVDSVPVSDEDADEDEAAAGTELSAKATGITFWVDPVAKPTVKYGAQGFLIEGRASKNLESVFSFSSDDEFGETLLVSKRKFEFFVDIGTIDRLMRGYRLFIEVDAATGTQRKYFVSIMVAPRFERFSGSTKIFAQKTVSPFSYGDEVRYRQAVSLASGYDGLFASTASGAQPLSISGVGAKRSVDWSLETLLEVAHDPDSSFELSASKGTTTVEKSVGADLVILDLAVSTQNPFDTWPEPQCAPEVLSCVQGLPAGQLDRSACGAAIDVLACRYLW